MRYATALGETNEPRGWRSGKATGDLHPGSAHLLTEINILAANVLRDAGINPSPPLPDMTCTSLKGRVGDACEYGRADERAAQPDQHRLARVIPDRTTPTRPKRVVCRHDWRIVGEQGA